MIDISAFQKMHPEERKIPAKDDNSSNILPREEADKEEPPEGDFLLFLPPNIYGFHMQDKKWGKHPRKWLIYLFALCGY